MEGKLVSHTLRISKLLKLHTHEHLQSLMLNAQNDKGKKLHSFKDMIRACKIENEETAWCSIFQIHKKEFRK